MAVVTAVQPGDAVGARVSVSRQADARGMPVRGELRRLQVAAPLSLRVRVALVLRARADR